jgi:hypothetical protein
MFFLVEIFPEAVWGVLYIADSKVASPTGIAKSSH